jgi:hypothetical protein
MAKVTALFDIVETFTIEFDAKLYFRVEVLRAESGEAIQVTKLSAEVYQLRWPTGMSAIPSPRSDTRFRQSWVFLEDFPAVEASTVESLRQELLSKLSAYADNYLRDYDATNRRVGLKAS